MKMKLKPEIVDSSFDLIKFRNDVDKATSGMKMPKGVTIEKQDIHGIYSEWIIPEQPTEGNVLLYIHGGGFISGSCDTHRVYVAKFAEEANLKSLVFDYRLAPEHPFPAAVEDCVTVYTWLLKNGYAPGNIVVGGESAGGTLTLSLLLALKSDGIVLPKAAFSISPVTDLRCMADSFRYNAKNDIAPQGSLDVWTRMYIGDNDPRNPVLSPQFGDFHGFPPIHICVGTHEIHLDDCIHFADKATEHGVDLTLRKWPKMVHAFPLLSPLFPEAKDALVDICDFITRQIDE